MPHRGFGSAQDNCREHSVFYKWTAENEKKRGGGGGRETGDVRNTGEYGLGGTKIWKGSSAQEEK